MPVTDKSTGGFCVITAGQADARWWWPDIAQLGEQPETLGQLQAHLVRAAANITCVSSLNWFFHRPSVS